MAKTVPCAETCLLNVSTEYREIRTKEQLPSYRVCRKDNDSFPQSLRVLECLLCFNGFKNDAEKHGIVVDPRTVAHDIHNNAF